MYAKEILKNFRIDECKSVATPMCRKEKLSKDEKAEKVDEAFYKSLVGCLMYLTATRSDILHSISLLSRFTNCATETHLTVPTTLPWNLFYFYYILSLLVSFGSFVNFFCINQQGLWNSISHLSNAFNPNSILFIIIECKSRIVIIFLHTQPPKFRSFFP